MVDYLDAMPGYFSVVDNESRFVRANKAQANAVGFKAPLDIEGASYEDFKCKASEESALFVQQDQRVMQLRETLSYLSYTCLDKGDWQLLLLDKGPVINKQDQVEGVICYSRNMTNTHLIDMSRFLFRCDHEAYGIKQFVYQVIETNLWGEYELTEKEQLVLFYLLRGKTARQTAQAVNLSERTVEMRVDILKEKFSVKTKPHLLEKAVFKGYLTMLPKSIILNGVA